MRIGQALNSKKVGDKVSSKSLGMKEQSLESLAFWLLVDPDTGMGKKIKTLVDVLSATDWEIDEND